MIGVAAKAIALAVVETIAGMADGAGELLVEESAARVVAGAALAAAAAAVAAWAAELAP
jgi:hypothetical protein